MKRVFLFALLCAAFSVNADPRCNQDIGTAHYPYDPIDTDNEYKFSSKVGLKEISGQGAVACYGVTKFDGVPYNVAPENSYVTGNDSDASCVMVNDDGQETQTEVWQVSVKRTCPYGLEGEELEGSRCVVMYEIRCGRFVPRPY